MFNELQAKTLDLQSLQQQTATADVLKVISRSAFDLEPVLDALLSSACRLCEADLGTIRYREGGGDSGLRQHWLQTGMDRAFRTYSTKPDRSSVFGRTIIEGHTVHIPDLLPILTMTGRREKLTMGFRAALGVPLTREGETFGVINLFRFNVGSFEDKQIELVQTFAGPTVIAIENGAVVQGGAGQDRGPAEIAGAADGSTADVLKVMSHSTFDLQMVLDTLVSSAAQLVRRQSSRGVIYQKDSEMHP